MNFLKASPMREYGSSWARYCSSAFDRVRIASMCSFVYSCRSRTGNCWYGVGRFSVSVPLGSVSPSATSDMSGLSRPASANFSAEKICWSPWIFRTRLNGLVRFGVTPSLCSVCTSLTYRSVVSSSRTNCLNSSISFNCCPIRSSMCLSFTLSSCTAIRLPIVRWSCSYAAASLLTAVVRACWDWSCWFSVLSVISYKLRTAS